MNVLILGSGGREHALAWKLSRSPRLQSLFCAPGNAGTSALAENLSVPVDGSDGFDALAKLVHAKKIGLVLVGPEAPLAAGVADRLLREDTLVFGPTKQAAEIESSKAFAKDFMRRHQIPTARYGVFTSLDAALSHLFEVGYPVVIKASGLAAGKGVVLPQTREEAEAALRSMLQEKVFGEAGQEVVIEERLEGPEVSVLAFSDGETFQVMPPAQDHKRLLGGDKGPNTGGMGAYAPAPICTPGLLEEVSRTILAPAIKGLRDENRKFVGVLYAGVMLTKDGPKALEFNARFGDPETEVLLPLLETDLLEIAMACAQGRLKDLPIRWKKASALCVVLASENYPEKPFTGRVIQGLEKNPDQSMVFHSGTKEVGGRTVTAGGRVLTVTGFGEDLWAAHQNAYRAVARLSFPGMQYRKDIGRQALSKEPQVTRSVYAAAGVDISAGNRAVELMKVAVRSTHGPRVLADLGSFGGLYDASDLAKMRAPVLVASTDGVGTKAKLAAETGRYRGVGIDIVNHCVNDILVQGAKPLFFLDYIASSKLEPEAVAETVRGMAEACKEAGCALLGGETAEMPGVYSEGAFDVAGTIVGVVERSALLPRNNLKAGDVLLGLSSSGPHTNGYSLIRKVFADSQLNDVFPELGAPLVDVLLAPHRSYLPLLLPILSRPDSPIKALAHITGGGFIENIPRVLTDNLSARIDARAWAIPPLFQLIASRGGVPKEEMFRVLNMGIGMVLIVGKERVQELQQLLVEPSFVIGELLEGVRTVVLA